MKYIVRLSIMMIIITILSACTSTNKVLFSDDFSRSNGNWDEYTDDNMTTTYYENAYRILVNLENYDAWANPADLSFTDVQVEVDATKNGGPDTNDYGIICRYKSTDSYYYGVIASDGYYGIYKKTAEGGKQLGMGGEQFTDKITTGAVTNHIRFDCVGSTLSLYVNGNLIDQQTDSSYTDGNVGLIAGSYTQSGVDILFDNFIVYQPTPAQQQSGN
ncbi:MAG: hypothetical protein C3F13_07585 [Anaerolineales bacterium]|nr:hypothetical protein [Anaerolineae bacterium]PWB54145.1 MAG: hypothetical protein C3F13_07585 [Anaerolineales bacterium]